ncbi:hypothetical protein, conserved, containing leucine zipper motif [Thermococcus kodakarensis KOD1]|uniref:Uncharacterized protein n=2 Tax=Thermococcus TaxID=2263 RepID=Q5JEC7_THEKO|nr:hypothetical protein [Thermococcus kodakarensis]WCN28152.1 hypothetical protein POG15_00175 [Thermococcus kodakarensis]WCN30450.1 hypothetical protein POG21_00175 [Thermococcus kodakarensis]BAD84222.1 hypothetical protein, conserved, containing leucine zipper motif [Thermococcus kodakarensis KOD1]
MLGKSKGGKGDWDYIVQNHPEIIEELKSLHNWDEIKSIIPEAENLGAYHLISLQAIAALIRELKIQRGHLSERIERLSSNLDYFHSTQREQNTSFEKRLKELEDRISTLEQRTLFMDSVEAIIPRMNELEEKLEGLPAELYKRLEGAYSQKLDEEMRKIVAEKVEELKKELEQETLSVGVELARTLKEIQEHYERLVQENVKLKGLARENEALKRELLEKERELEELRKRLALMDEMTMRVEKLGEKINAYEVQLRKMKAVEKQLLEITGARDVSSAIEIIKKEFIPRSKFEKILGEVKAAVAEMDVLKEENERLRRENEKLKDALKMLLQERTSSENTEQESLLLKEEES